MSVFSSDPNGYGDGYDTDDDWFEQRYWAALYADHEKGHPNRGTPGPVAGCPDCENP